MAINIKLSDTKDVILKTANKYCNSDINVSVDNLYLKSKYILKDKAILGVAGELISPEITYEATATAGDILKNKTAWVRGEKIKGTIDVYSGKTEEITKGNTLFDIESDSTNEQAVSTSEGLTIVGGIVTGIGTCTDTDIVLGKELIGIAKEAFRDCDNIESIVIEEGMTFIEPYAFLNCANLEVVSIPESVTIVSEGIFSGCSSLRQVTVPYAHKLDKKTGGYITNFGYFFGETPFYNSIAVTQGFGEIRNYYGSGYSYSTSSKTYYLPETLREVKVLGGLLHDSNEDCDIPFENCSMITSIELGANVTVDSSVDHPNFSYPNAFKGCDNLYTVSVDPNNKQIDSREHCNAVIYTSKNALVACCNGTTIPESVKTITSGAFEYCNELVSVYIPAGVSLVRGNPFKGCNTLKTIEVAAGNSVYDSRRGCNAIIETETNLLIAGCRTTTIPNTVTAIGVRAFSDVSELAYLTLPTSITSIGYMAFSGCTGLHTIGPFNNVTSMGSDTFRNCYNLTNVDLSTLHGPIPRGCFQGCKNLTEIKLGAGITALGSDAFRGTVITNIIFPKEGNLTTIDADCFEYISTLKHIALPEGLEVIASDAFYQAGLETIILPKSVKEIGMDAFWLEETSMKAIYYKGTPDDWSNISMGSRNYGLTWDSDVRYYYSESEPEDVQHRYWHYDTDGITPILWDVEIDISELHDSVGLDIRGDALYGPGSCTDKVIKVPEGITKIVNPNSSGNILTSRYPRATTIILPESLTRIEDWGLHCGKNLIDLKIPNSVNFIGEYGLGLNSSLQHVTLPESLTEIPLRIFSSCDSLESVVIPKSVTSIRPDTITSSRVDLYYKGTINDWLKIKVSGYSNFTSCNPLDHTNNFYVLDPNGKTLFEGNNYTNLTELNIPASVTSLDAICAWNSLNSIKVDAANTTYDSRGNCNAVINTATNTLVLGCNNTTIPNTVNKIASSAFRGCNNLTKITLPNSLTSIGSYCFMGCKNLTEVTLPNNLKTIPIYAFANCGITSITIPDSVTTIDYYAFTGNKYLKNVVLGNSVTFLDGSALPSSVETIVIPKSLTSFDDYTFYNSDLKEVYYRGTKEEWDNISKGSSNNDLKNATIHYNYVD